jgi:hypothetical protein
MTARTAEDRSGEPDDVVIYVVITPDGELLQQCADGRPDPARDLDDPYQPALWGAVEEAVALGLSAPVHGFPVPAQDMRAKMVDSEAAEKSDLYRPNPFASAVLFILGLRLSSIALGPVAIVHEEDPNTGFTGSLNPDQLKAISEAHATVTGTVQDTARRRDS